MRLADRIRDSGHSCRDSSPCIASIVTPAVCCSLLAIKALSNTSFNSSLNTTP
jgi:hypothetical protein